MKKVGVILIFLFLIVTTTYAQGPDDFIFGDPLPDAPALAPRGDYGVGVRTLDLVNPGQPDILNAVKGEPVPTYDRPLTVEIWYPAVIPDGTAMLTEYEDTLGIVDNPDRPLTPFTFAGRALRDADPDPSGGPYPLIIVSHGYPGSRFMLTNLTENLASKGYVVVAIDHTDSLFSDAVNFGSTLLNRSLDILFVLNEMDRLSTEESFLTGLADAQNAALIGYSMGGYGSIDVAGAGLSPFAAGFIENQTGVPGADVRALGNAPAIADRIKAVVAVAPWGMNYGLWEADALANIQVPLFFIAGSQDDVAGYENGIVKFFEGAVNADRYLLTYEGARHNVVPNPPPAEATNFEEYMRYGDNVWDTRRINNVNQHFLTAFLGIYLKGQTDYQQYLDVIEVAAEGVYSVNDDGTPKADYTYWAGFAPRTAVGLTLKHAAPQE